MFQLGLNLDGTLKKKATAQDRLGEDDNVPGLYSPRPQVPQPSPHPSAPAQRKTAVATSPFPLSASKHANPSPVPVISETVAAEEAAIGISDPDMDVILAGGSKPRLSDASDEGSSGDGAGEPPIRSRRAGAMTTLVEHQKARQKSPPTAMTAAAGSGRPASVLATRRTPAADEANLSVPAASSKVASQGPSAPLGQGEGTSQLATIRLEEAYIRGHTCAQHMSTASARLTGFNGVLNQSPMQYISAIATSAEYVALGDRTGHVVVMKQAPMSAAQQRAILEEARHEDEDNNDGRSHGRHTAPRCRDHYDFFAGQQVYNPVIDPLNSVMVTPNVAALAFLPQTSSTAYLLTANEKVPKLHKVMTVQESIAPFEAIANMDVENIHSLITRRAPLRTPTSALKPVARYALSHEYNIHSICPLADSEQFVTADDLAMHLWCTEYPDTSMETFDIRPPFEDDPREAIRCVRNFPHEPFLLFAATSAGNVRVMDIRQALRWSRQTPQVFTNPTRDLDGSYNNVTNSLSDCALSPCGRYIAGRDFMTACLWDIRSAGGYAGSPNKAHARSDSNGSPWGMVRSWELHPELHKDLETLFQSELLFERFDIQFMGPTQVCTGGLRNTLYTVDVSSSSEEVKKFPLLQPNMTREDEDNAAASANFGSRLNLLSRPMQSFGGACGMFACCGQTALQVSYKAL